MAPLDFEADHEALQAIAKRLRVGVFVNRRARHAGLPFVELYTRGLLLSVHRNHREAAAWLQPVQRSDER